MNDNGTRYRVGRTSLIIVKPNGDVVSREVQVSHDAHLALVEFTFLGESQLRGYSFGVLLAELDRIRETGVPADEVPKPL